MDSIYYFFILYGSLDMVLLEICMVNLMRWQPNLENGLRKRLTDKQFNPAQRTI